MSNDYVIARQPPDLGACLDILLLAWVGVRSVTEAPRNEDTLTEAQQVAGIAFNFCLLAAGLAGLGRHSWHIHSSLHVLLDKVYP